MSSKLNNIFGVVVLYNSKFEDTITYKTIFQALTVFETSLEILLYDNSPQPQHSEEYFENHNFKMHYIHNASNPGVGKAYNTGAKLAKKTGKNWLLLLDQDTEFPNTIFDAYFKGIENNPSIELIAPILHLSNGSIFSPCRYILNRGFSKKSVKPGLNSLKYSSPVNSGMLIDVGTFDEAGGYNEKIKLDFSDFQFIEKFKKTRKNFLLLNEICVQDFSNDVSNIDSLERRFKIYCNDAKSCISYKFYDPLLYATNALLRSVKLSIRWKRISFIKTWFTQFIIN